MGNRFSYFNPGVTNTVHITQDNDRATCVKVSDVNDVRNVD